MPDSEVFPLVAQMRVRFASNPVSCSPPSTDIKGVMDLTIKRIKGTDYIYHTFKDPRVGGTKWISCGAVDKDGSQLRALTLGKQYLEHRRVDIDVELERIESNIKQIRGWMGGIGVHTEVVLVAPLYCGIIIIGIVPKSIMCFGVRITKYSLLEHAKDKIHNTRKITSSISEGGKEYHLPFFSSEYSFFESSGVWIR